MKIKLVSSPESKRDSRAIQKWIPLEFAKENSGNDKFLGYFFALSLLLLAACSSSEEKPYADYDNLRNEATARCEKLGFLPGTAEFYSCVGVQYTRIKQERLSD